MKITSDISALKVLYNEWQENEDKLQAQWGFTVDRSKQGWYNVPKCACPKLDNQDLFGTDYQIYSKICPFHGFKNDLES